jgi:hypothetical protein
MRDGSGRAGGPHGDRSTSAIGDGLGGAFESAGVEFGGRIQISHFVQTELRLKVIVEELLRSGRETHHSGVGFLLGAGGIFDARRRCGVPDRKVDCLDLKKFVRGIRPGGRQCSKTAAPSIRVVGKVLGSSRP